MNNTVVIRKWDFDTDAELVRQIEALFGVVERDSNKAWEEYVEIRGFGSVQKPEGRPIAYISDLEQGLTLRACAKTFALACDSEDDLPIVRAVLYGVVCGMVGARPKAKLHCFWRLRPVTEKDSDFDSRVTKHKVVFRLGAWYAPNEPLLADAVDL